MLLRLGGPPALTLTDLLSEVADGIESAIGKGESPDATADEGDVVLWEPLAAQPGRGMFAPDGSGRIVSPQQAALESMADELFYGGAGGGGKTDLLLGAAITRHRNSIIFRTEFTQFRGAEGLIERSRDIIGDYGDLNENLFVWRRLPGDRAIEFGAVKTIKDLSKYKGRPHDLKGFDELPDFPEYHYRFLIAWLRTAYPGQRTRVISTGNPPTTAEGEWVNRYWGPWLDRQHPHPAATGELVWFATLGGKDVEVGRGPARPAPVEWENKEGAVEVIAPRSRTFIPARVEDNPHYMRTGYTAVLDNLPEPLRSQLRHGRFDVGQQDHAWQIIPTEWVKAAMARWVEKPPVLMPLTAVGVDPSRGGVDKFVVAPRHANWFAPLRKHEGSEAPDGEAGASLIVKDLEAEPLALEVPVNIDIVGTAGGSVYDQARQLRLKARPMNGANKSVARDKSGKLGFVNKRAEWHWKMREDLDPTSGQDIALPPDPELLADLCATRWKITPRGIQAEDKELVKTRIGRSPDCGEAVIYANAEGSEVSMDEGAEYPLYY